MSDEVNKVTFPKHIKVINCKDGIIIRRAWFHYSVIQILFGCLMWNGFVMYWYRDIKFAKDITTVIVMLLPLLVSVILTYVTLAKIINRTDIHISKNFIKITMHPLPWYRNREILRADIKQIVAEYKSSVSDAQFFMYDIYAVYINGSKKLIINNIETLEQSTFIENTIKSAFKMY